MSLSAAKLLINGLELIGPAKCDQRNGLIRQTDLHRGSRFQRITCTSITTDKNLVVFHQLPYTDLAPPHLRSHEGGSGLAVSALSLRDSPRPCPGQDRPTGCHRICSRASRGGYDHAIPPEMLHRDIITVDTEIQRLL